MINDLLKGTCLKYGLKSVLESPADGITGVPGANSLCLAELAEKPVALSNPSALLLERAGDTWKQMGLAGKMELCQCPVAKLKYPDRSYDLVWSFCMLEQMKYPESYLREISRVSEKAVMMITVNDNSGVRLHRLWHKFKNIPWDHGNEALMTKSGITAAFIRVGLKVVETGGVDVPPTLDTSDMSLTADLRRIAGLFGKKWDWKLKGEEQGPGFMLRFFSWLEHNLPMWFKIKHAHHIYVVGMKNDGFSK
ncbi:MAG: methyltransferase domain-containing protein, partial [Desulfocucumaceae bacterium]